MPTGRTWMHDAVPGARVSSERLKIPQSKDLVFIEVVGFPVRQPANWFGQAERGAFQIYRSPPAGDDIGILLCRPEGRGEQVLRAAVAEVFQRREHALV